MCGIIGIVGNSAVSDRLVDGLKRMEYRGYDSAGVCTVYGGQLIRRRAEGKLANLVNVLKTDDAAGNFTVTGITAMENTNQAAVGTCAYASTNPSNNNIACTMETTTTLAVETANSSGTSADVVFNQVVINGDLA